MMNKETQECTPSFEKGLERVGIKGLRTLVKTGFEGHIYKFVPTFDIYIDLKADKKGIHMSRLVESISEIVTEEAAFQCSTFEELEKKIIDRLNEKHDFERAEVALAAELVTEKKTPVSKKTSMETHDIEVVLIYCGGEYIKELKVTVVGNTACPHSKENTNRPHIQRAISDLEITCPLDAQIGLTDMIACVESAFSSEVYTIVKTDDENELVRRIYDNPKFVEDVTRDILSEASRKFGRKADSIFARTRSQESIHRHDVVAEGRI